MILPASNVQHLMLREDVVEAVKAGQFRVHSVVTVDEALELLTGIPAGKQGPDGTYPPDSVNGLVQAKLLRFAAQLQAFSGHHAHVDEIDEPYQGIDQR